MEFVRRSNGVSAAEVANVPCVGCQGLVLTSRSEGSEVVVGVRVTVAVSSDDPNIGLTVTVSYVGPNFEKFRTCAVDDTCTDNVTALVDVGDSL